MHLSKALLAIAHVLCTYCSRGCAYCTSGTSSARPNVLHASRNELSYSVSKIFQSARRPKGLGQHTVLPLPPSMPKGDLVGDGQPKTTPFGKKSTVASERQSRVRSSKRTMCVYVLPHGSDSTEASKHWCHCVKPLAPNRCRVAEIRAA